MTAPSPRRPRSLRTTLPVAATALFLVAYALTLAWWIDLRHDLGWIGVGYQGPEVADDEMPEIPLARHFVGEAGEIQVLHHGAPGERAGLRRGDLIRSIQGIPVDDQEALRALGRRLERGDVVVYRVARPAPAEAGPTASAPDGASAGEGEVLEVRVPLESPFRIPYLWVGLLINSLVGLGYLAVSLWVLWSRPRSAQALVFYLLCTAGAAFFFFNSFAEVEMQGSRGFLSTVAQNTHVMPFFLTYAVLGLVTANLLLHLILIFPRRRPLVQEHPQSLVWLHTVGFLPALVLFLGLGALVLESRWDAMRWVFQAAGAAGLLAALWRLRGRARRLGTGAAAVASPLAVQGAILATVLLVAPLVRSLPEDLAVTAVVLAILGALALYFLVLPVVLVVLTLVPLVRNYREAGVEEKRQLRWPLWGTAVVLGVGSVVLIAIFIATAIDPDSVQKSSWSLAGNSLFKLLNLLIPVSFAFAIAKYRLMDIDLILRKTAVYGAMSGFVVAGYLVLVGGVGLALLAWTRVENQVVAVVATLVLAALFVPVRNRVQRWVDRRFGRGGPDPGEALERLRRAVVGAAELDPLLAEMAETAQQALGVRTLVLFVQQPDGRRLVARAKVGLPDDLVGRLALDPASLAGAGRVAAVDGLPLGDDDRETLRRVRAELVAPARRQAEAAGAVVVGRKLAGPDMDADDRELLAAVADQLALAVGTLGPRREALELDQARVLQRSLLPDRMPEVPGVELEAAWHPAREVAGDYYDLLVLGDGRLGLCIGDVAGKGMAAALLMSSLQAAVRAVAAPDVAPDRVCEQVRRVVCRSLSGGRFVTFFYALLDVPGRRLAYCNAGHTPPALARGDGSLEWLERGGGAFARLLADSPLETTEVEVAPGDRLVLYTDGVTEAHLDGGEMLGEAGLERLLRGAPASAADTRRHLLAAVADRSGPQATDDVTLLVARLV